MKTLFIGLISLLCLTVGAQYANTNTGTIGPLPIVLYSSDGSSTMNPTPGMLAGVGWLKVGYTQIPSNGWAMLGNYAISPSSNGYCSLLITGQYNLQVAADAAWTNAPNWPTLNAEALGYSNLSWKYSPGHYTASLSNFVNTPQFTMSYYTALCATNPTPITVSNTVDFMTAIAELSDLINAAGTSTNFPWRLVK